MTNDLENTLLRLEETARTAAKSNAEFLGTLPASSPCPHHPGKFRPRDDQQSCRVRKVVFLPCELCDQERRQRHEVERLHDMGVPFNLCNATFDNWTPADEQDQGILASVRQFVSVRKGFLILLGDLGTGKTHLAVAALRPFRSGLFLKQSELLRRLRQTYRDKAAVDPVDEAQSIGCLVLDEVGISPGGRDELPLLHDGLYYRHGNMKPTILTGNLSLDALRDVIGERMADRIKESAYAVLQFGGASKRREARELYFQ